MDLRNLLTPPSSRTRPHCTAQVCLTLSVPQPHAPKGWDYRHAPSHGTGLLLCMLPPTDRYENHGPLASFPLYKIVLNYNQVPLFTLFSAATNLTLYGKFLLSPETLCSQNTKLDKFVFLVAFSLAKLANEFADFKDTSSDMKEEEHWVH